MEMEQTLFVAYKFTEEELQQAVKLQPQFRCYLQTVLARVATQKVEFATDSADVNSLQQEAELHGQLRILKELLAEVPLI